MTHGECSKMAPTWTNRCTATAANWTTWRKNTGAWPEITDHFRLPVQQVIIWRGSDKDDVDVGRQRGWRRIAVPPVPRKARALKVSITTCSIHKEPVLRAERTSSAGAAGARYRGDRLYRAIQWSRPDAVSLDERPGDYGPGKLQGFPRGCVVFAANPVERAGYDGARTFERRHGRRRNPGAGNPQFDMYSREQLEERLTNTIPL